MVCLVYLIFIVKESEQLFFIMKQIPLDFKSYCIHEKTKEEVIEKKKIRYHFLKIIFSLRYSCCVHNFIDKLNKLMRKTSSK